MKYTNESEKFWKHSYRVHLSYFDTDGLLINADNEQDALDYAIDHAEEIGWTGLFCEDECYREHPDGDCECIIGGNRGHHLESNEVHIEQID